MIDIKLATDFGDLLDRMIRGRYLSIHTTMDVLGVSRAMVDKYRRNGSKPDPEKLRKFAARFGYDYGELVKLTYGEVGLEQTEAQYRVQTERGAIVARMFENLPNAEARAAIYELLSSLSKEPKRTASND